MTTLKKAITVTAASIVLLGMGAAASAATLTFDTLPAGTTAITTQIPGVTISASGGTNQAWIYNTGPNGDTADPDLAGPFTNINDALVSVSPGNVLIVQELDSVDSDPGPDDNGGGGTLSLSFENAVTMLSMDVFDMKAGSKIQLFSDESFVTQIGMDFITANSDTNNAPNFYEQIVFGIGGTAGVKGLRVIMEGSGAIDNVSYVPLPAAAWLFGSALLGLVGVSRRKKV